MTRHGYWEADDRAFRALVERAVAPLVLSDENGTIVYASPSVTQLLGSPPGALVGRGPLDLFHVDDVERLATTFAARLGMLGAGGPVDCRARHRDGTWCWVEVQVTNLLADPAVAGMVMTLRDVSGRKQLEEQLTRQALHDPLTGLPNRALLTDRLVQALERLGRRRAHVAVLMLDLDGFKALNDSRGHLVGDDALVAVARRLEGLVRPEDTVARFGGDEFVVVCQDIDGLTDADHVRERIAAAFARSFAVRGDELWLGASMGMAVTDHAGRDPDELLREADTQMYRAKREDQGDTPDATDV